MVSVLVVVSDRCCLSIPANLGVGWLFLMHMTVVTVGLALQASVEVDSSCELRLRLTYVHCPPRFELRSIRNLVFPWNLDEAIVMLSFISSIPLESMSGLNNVAALSVFLHVCLPKSVSALFCSTGLMRYSSDAWSHAVAGLGESPSKRGGVFSTVCRSLSSSWFQVAEVDFSMSSNTICNISMCIFRLSET